MAATQEELSLDEGKAKTDEAYAYLQRKKQDSTRSYADKDKIWLLQQTLLLSSHRSDAEVLECLGLSLALSPPLNGWWFKTFMLPGDAVPISMSTPELLKHGFQIYKPLFCIRGEIHCVVARMSVRKANRNAQTYPLWMARLGRIRRCLWAWSQSPSQRVTWWKKAWGYQELWRGGPRRGVWEGVLTWNTRGLAWQPPLSSCRRYRHARDVPQLY